LKYFEKGSSYLNSHLCLLLLSKLKNAFDYSQGLPLLNPKLLNFLQFDIIASQKHPEIESTGVRHSGSEIEAI